MKQVVQHLRQNSTTLLDVPAPQVGRGEVLVSTKASLISSGTEKMLIDFAGKSMLGKAKERPDLAQQVMGKVQRDGLVATAKSVFSKLEQPLPLGYSAAGEIIAVGAGLESKFKIGDRVAIAGAGAANHAEVNAVSKNLVAKMPDDVGYHHACFATLAAIAMQGVRNAKIGLGDRVLVVGAGLIGQLTAQLVRAGGGQSFITDYDSDRLKIAAACGAAFTHNIGLGDMNAFVQSFTRGRGFDAVIICAATESNMPLEQAAQYARDRATVVMTGKTGSTVPYGAFMKKELNLVVSRSYGPGRYDPNFEKKGQNYPLGFVRWTETAHLEEALRLMATGDLNIAPLLSHTFSIEKAEEAYQLVLGDAPTLGVVLEYPRPDDERLENRLNLRPITIQPHGSVGVSLLGAGAFAQGTLLPALKKIPDAQLVGALSKSGVSAKIAGERFGFNYIASNETEIFDDEATKAVVIATRHDSHAALVCQALQAGKHVFVEKPLGLDHDELDAVESLYQQANAVLMVGFNRRYAPFTMALKDKFKHVGGPRQVIIRVNAGRLPEDNWQHDPETGGGRMVGEVCHFIDLALALVDSRVEDIYAVSGKGQDVYTITLNHADGSLSTICYTSEGDSSFSKEYIEMYAGGQVAVIDNFMRAKVVSGGKETQFKVKDGLFTGRQDKGHTNELMHFIAAIKGEAPALDVQAMFQSSRLTLLALQSMREGVPLKAMW